MIRVIRVYWSLRFLGPPARIDFAGHPRDIQLMSDTLSIRIAVDEKRRLAELAAQSGETVNEFVRKSIRARVAQIGRDLPSPLREFFGSVDATVPPPTNKAVRRALRGGR